MITDPIPGKPGLREAVNASYLADSTRGTLALVRNIIEAGYDALVAVVTDPTMGGWLDTRDPDREGTWAQ